MAYIFCGQRSRPPPMTTLSRNAGVTLAERTRADFPILDQLDAQGGPLIYLDHAATSQAGGA